MLTLVVGDYPTAEEERRGRPFSSEAGMEFRRNLSGAGFVLTDCRFTNVTKEHPFRDDNIEFFETTAEMNKSGNNIYGLAPMKKARTWLTELYTLIEELQPDLIIAAGNYAMWALYGETGEVKIGNRKKTKAPSGITNWRGSHLYYQHDGPTTIPLLPVLDQYLTNKAFGWQYKTKHDLSVRLGMLKKGKWDEPENVFEIRPSFDQAKTWLEDFIVGCDEALLQCGQYKIACDLETFGGHITCCGFAWSSTHACCIPFLTKGNTPEGYLVPYWDEMEEIILTDLLGQLFNHPGLKLTGQNFLYDAQHIAFSWHVVPTISSDTMIQQHLIFPGTELDLVTLSSMYCEYHRYWKEDGKYWKSNADEEEYWVYNCRDCIITYEAGEGLEEAIAYYEQEEQWGYQIAQIAEILKMMLKGTLIDLEAKHIAATELAVVTEQFAEELSLLLPPDVYEQPKPPMAKWYNSTTQQARIFSDVFGMKPYWNRKKKKFTMDGAALASYAEKEPILRAMCLKLIEYNSLTTFKTFTDMRVGPDGRMRSSFTPTASTFRWKSSTDAFGAGGNLQNIPKGNE